MAKGKGKGSAFERKICNQLSLWWSNGTNDNIFWRTAGSGARATVRAKKRGGFQKHGGDICAIDPIGEPLLKQFAIELKVGYNRVTIFDCMDAPASYKPQMFQQWVEQAKESQTQTNSKYWMLITQRTRRRAMVWLPSQMSCSFPLNRFIDVAMPKMHIIGMPLSIFLDFNTPQDFGAL